MGRLGDTFSGEAQVALGSRGAGRRSVTPRDPANSEKGKRLLRAYRADASFSRLGARTVQTRLGQGCT